jgi:hypothetical protein
MRAPHAMRAPCGLGGPRLRGSPARAFLREAPHLTLTLNTQRLFGRDLEGGSSSARAQLVPANGHAGMLTWRQAQSPALIVSKATRRARRKVISVLKEQAAWPTAASGGGVAVELVLAGNAVADYAGALSLLVESGQEAQAVTAGTAFLRGKQAGSALKSQAPGMQVGAHTRMAAWA